MADTWRQNAIVQAIQIIADKKISQAGYDKTIKGIINKVIDSASGKYQIRYQDSLFEAYATSSKITYNKDQEVSVLIPGNDWDRVKTILNSISSNAINYQQVPIVSDSYNTIGPNGTSLSQEIQLSSYIDQSVVLLDGQGISFNDISNYIKKGDSIALGMKIRTAFADGQVGGSYGLKFNLVFQDSVNKQQVIKSFNVSNIDVIGHPYQLTNSQWVETLITGVQTENFLRIDSIEAFCDGFPYDENKSEIKDIFISDIKINGADVLSDQDLNRTILHIDYSAVGNILGDGISETQLVAELKVNGKITTENVVYYWFRQNGTVFRGDVGKYSGYAGDGWECLNYYQANSFVPKKNNTFTFNTSGDNLANDSALANQKVTKVLCVAVYDNKDWIKGQIQIINNNINNDIRIAIEENQVQTGRTVYYLDNGRPNLICKTTNINGNLEYVWSVKPARGRAEEKPVTTQLNDEYAAAAQDWNQVQTKANNMAVASAESYKNSSGSAYTIAKNRFKQVQFVQRIQGDTYYNFPIKSIIDYSTVFCAVKANGEYIGTASVVLYNKRQLEGMYSLNLEYGTQVFQYDGKGNSPTSSQLEKPLEIRPLSFTLVDNQGKEITHEQIRNNGWIKWIFPNTQSLLKQSENGTGVTGDLDLTVTRADLPLPASRYLVFNGNDNFNYSIEDRYDEKKNINYIWLNVKFKDMYFDAYTNFTFPKDGDPGTNGTDYVSRIVPSLNTDRIYISSKNNSVMFNDDGATVDNLEYVLYNNSIATNNGAHYWTAPPKVSTTAGVDVGSIRTTFLTVTKGSGSGSPATYKTAKVTLSAPSNLTFENIVTKAPINIVRAQYGTSSDTGGLHYFAEFPICTEYITSIDNYRLKIKPKTGYNYVVYASDGTSPDYDNTLPFEVIVEKLVDSYYTIDTNQTYTYVWEVIGNLNGSSSNSNKTYIASPKSTFDGRNLSSAVICQVKKGENQIGFIHIPIYMILNRYNNRALNAWDGNSVQIDKNGNGQILTPQIAAGAKDSDNAFTGMLMGQIALNTTNADIGTNGDIGIMGYDSGVRTVFLDAKTGKAEFGKNNQGKIIIDPDTKINGQASALLYSNTFNKSKYVTAANTGNPASTVHDVYNSGLMIDLTSPTIQFGSGRFYVDKNGNIHAAGGGDIAGWNINDDSFYKHTGTYKTGMRSNGDPAFYAGTNSQNSISPGTTAAYNFFVNHDGYLYSKAGRIASWNIDINNISNGSVGMGNSHTTTKNTFLNQSSDITNGRIWSGTNGKDTFLVTADGKLYSQSGQIANWSINKSMLTDGNIGIGQYTFDSTNPFTNGSIQARIWGGSTASGINFKITSTTFNSPGLNFAVSSDGSLYSKKGFIGGWNIEQNKLWAGNTNANAEGIRINSNGTMDGKNWSIDANGNAYFNKIWGNVESTNATANNVYYLTGGGYTASSSGGYTSSGGSGYYLGSNGTMHVGSSGSYMDFNGSLLEVKGTIKADRGYISTWTISDDGISNPNGSYLYPNRLSINDNGEIMTMVGGSIRSRWMSAIEYFNCGGSRGKTGNIIFSDGSSITVTGGIITNVVPKAGSDEVIWSGN